MPTSCSAFGCTNHHLKKDVIARKVSFYKFPIHNQNLLHVWLANIKRANFKPTVYHKICSDHFEPDCFEYNKRRKSLTKDAVPTIFSFTNQKSIRKKSTNPLTFTEDMLPKHPALRKCWERTMKRECELQGQPPELLLQQSTKSPSKQPAKKPIRKQKEMCCILSCGAMNFNNPSITFHKFPDQESLLEKWLVQINLALSSEDEEFSPRSESVVCSKHFPRSDFEEDGITLKPSAVPVVFGQDIIVENEAGSSGVKPSTTPWICKLVKNSPKREKSSSGNVGHSSESHDGNSMTEKMDLDAECESDDDPDDPPDNSGPSDIGSNKPKLKCLGKIPNFNNDLKFLSCGGRTKYTMFGATISKTIKKLPCKSVNVSINLGAGSNMIERKTITVPILKKKVSNKIILDPNEVKLKIKNQSLSCDKKKLEEGEIPESRIERVVRLLNNVPVDDASAIESFSSETDENDSESEEHETTESPSKKTPPVNSAKYFTDNAKLLNLLEQKYKQIASLKFQVVTLTEELDSLKEKYNKQEKLVSTTDKNLEIIKEEAKTGDATATFLLEQINKFGTINRGQWSDSTMSHYAEWVKDSNQVYETIKKTNLFQMPTLKTIKKYIKNQTGESQGKVASSSNDDSENDIEIDNHPKQSQKRNDLNDDSDNVSIHVKIVDNSEVTLNEDASNSQDDSELNCDTTENGNNNEFFEDMPEIEGMLTETNLDTCMDFQDTV